MNKHFFRFCFLFGATFCLSYGNADACTVSSQTGYQFCVKASGRLMALLPTDEKHEVRWIDLPFKCKQYLESSFKDFFLEKMQRKTEKSLDASYLVEVKENYVRHIMTFSNDGELRSHIRIAFKNTEY